MKQKGFNNLAKRQNADSETSNEVSTMAWKRGYLYAMNTIYELFGDEIEEVSCLQELSEMLDEAEQLHE